MRPTKAQRAQRCRQHGSQPPQKRSKHADEPRCDQPSNSESNLSRSPSTVPSDEDDYQHGIEPNHDETSVEIHNPAIKTRIKIVHRLDRINSQWEELNNAIEAAAFYYDSYKMSNSVANQLFDELAELREFNHRRRQLNNSNSVSMSMQASMETVQTSFLRRRIPRSDSEVGSGHAARIRKQAAHIIIHKRLPVRGNGLSTEHPSILDNREVFRMITEWISTQKVGKVCDLSHLLLLN